METISYAKALRLIARHGWRPDDVTAFYGTGSDDGDPTSTFHTELGRHETYSLRAILIWLGY
jgi:hypothetical protein